MKTLMAPAVVLALAIGSAAAGDKVVLKGNAKTYTGEVIAVDTTAKRLSIKSDTGTSTLRVDDSALASLEGVKPGDRITITLRDEATGRRQAVSAVVSGTMSGSAVATPDKAMVATTEKTVVLKQAGTAMEFVNLDPATRTVTVLGENGARQSVRVDEKTMLSLANVTPGQKIFVSYRFDRAGKPEAVVRVGAVATHSVVTTSVATKPVARPKAGAVEVLSTDPTSSTLTIRTEAGRERTLVVDELAIVDLQRLKPGDEAFLTLEGDRVLVITRNE